MVIVGRSSVIAMYCINLKKTFHFKYQIANFSLESLPNTINADLLGLKANSSEKIKSPKLYAPCSISIDKLFDKFSLSL